MKSKILKAFALLAVAALVLMGASTGVTQLWVQGPSAFPSIWRNAGGYLAYNAGTTQLFTVHPGTAAGGLAICDQLTGSVPTTSCNVTLDSSGDISTNGALTANTGITTNGAVTAAGSMAASGFTTSGTVQAGVVNGVNLSGHLAATTWQEGGTCSPGSAVGDSCYVSITWRNYFATTGYVAVCGIKTTSLNPVTGIPLFVGNITPLSGSQISVQIYNLLGGSGGGGLLDCIATQN